MKTRNMYRWAISLFLIVLASYFGCKNESPTDVEKQEPGKHSLAKKGRVVESVTGSGRFLYEGEFRTFSFRAMRREDGTVDGHYQVYLWVSGTLVRVRGNIDCLTIFGVDKNQARLGGFSESMGHNIFWDAIDNGRGPNADADRISLAYGSGCQVAVYVQLFELSAGDIKVRTEEP